VATRQSVVHKVKKSHGGPITSEEELDATLKKFPDELEQQRILALEIFYQKDIIYESRAVIDKTIFVVRKMNADGMFNFEFL
jgi:hypothetical protein